MFLSLSNNNSIIIEIKKRGRDSPFFYALSRFEKRLPENLRQDKPDYFKSIDWDFLKYSKKYKIYTFIVKIQISY
jgi:hypothetical protein